MKNLKRALSLALASFMLTGTMAVGASAAEFGDADKIQHTDAVNTMAALGIIKGKDSGDFDPEGIVTRAEMAKMICVALNGGTDPNLAGGGLYPDTKGHWASGYIDYCTNMGIVSGDNKGMFNPDDTVTTVEASKMILIAMGYNAVTEKFVNDANWSINISVTASARGLYKNVPALATAPLNRDNAAQMIFNGIQEEMVSYRLVGIIEGNGVSEAREDGRTILSEKYGAYKEAPEGILTEFSYNDTKKEFTYTVIDTAENRGRMTFKTTNDFTDMYGRNVRVIAEQTDDKEVYGIFAQDSTVVASGYAGDIEQPTANKKEVTINDVDYKLDEKASKIGVYNFSEDTTPTTLDQIDTQEAKGKTYSFQAVDNDNDGKIDRVNIVPFTVAKVTYVGKDSITLNNGINSVKFEDANIYEDVAKNDYVTYTDGKYTANRNANVEKATVQTGTISGIKDGKYLIDGVWMTNHADVTERLQVNDTIDYIAFGTKLYYAKVTAGDYFSNEVAFVYKAGKTQGDDLNSGDNKVALIFGDGTKKTVVAKENYENLCGSLVTYTVNNDKEYELKAVSTTNLANYDKYATGALNSTGTISTVAGGYTLSDNAVVVLYKYVDNGMTSQNAKVITGKEAKDLMVSDFKTSYALINETNGFNYAEFVALIPAKSGYEFPTTFTGNTYGYLTTDAYRTVKEGTNYLNFTIWTGTEEITVVAKTDDAAANFKANTVVSYDTVDASTIKNVTNVEMKDKETVKVAAVTGYDEKAEKVQIDCNGVMGTYKITKDTAILYVDSKDKVGVAGGSIELADKNTQNNTLINNVKFLANFKDELVVLVVDVNNEMK